MFYKLSNTASLEQIEDEFNAIFLFPSLHVPSKIINGMQEKNLPIITSQDHKKITPSIWGILPFHYSNDWATFQCIANTLNIPYQSLDRNIWYLDALDKRRCLILITGFYAFRLEQGEVFPFYIFLPTGKPFALAGIYNPLDDGFLSCSPITCAANDQIGKIHNIGREMPLCITPELRKQWLDPMTPISSIKEMIQPPTNPEFSILPVSKRILKFKKDKLKTVVYQEFPFTDPFGCGWASEVRFSMN